MAKLTLTQYLNYLGTETRTMGWGALLIYDRAKTNALLAQEYIERFDKNQYFPPFNDSEETDQNAWSDMQDFILDRPRLSFTNSNIASSRARLSMKVVGGKYVTLVKPIGTGPFKFVEWQSSQRVVVERNADYWDGAPALEAVVFRPITDANTRVAEMMAGGLDVMVEVPPVLMLDAEAEAMIV